MKHFNYVVLSYFLPLIAGQFDNSKHLPQDKIYTLRVAIKFK